MTKQLYSCRVQLYILLGSSLQHNNLPTDVLKFPKMTFEWQLLQSGSTTFDEKC